MEVFTIGSKNLWPGNTDVSDLPRSGRPVSVSTPENVALIESKVREDKCITIEQLEQSMEISSGGHSFHSDYSAWFPIHLR